MEVLEVLRLISDKLPGVDIEQLARDIEKKNNAYSVLAIEFEDGKLAELTDFLMQYKQKEDYIIDMGSNVVAYLLKNKNKDEYRSASDFAQLLKTGIEQEGNLSVKIGIGEFGGHKQLSAFAESLTALKLSHILGGKGVFSYKEYVVLSLFDEIPKDKMEAALDVLLDKNTLSILADKEMLETAEEFMQCSLNVSETARNLYLHRNTLLYRLDKIQDATGLDIRQFSDAITFKIVTWLYRINKDKE